MNTLWHALIIDKEPRCGNVIMGALHRFLAPSERPASTAVLSSPEQALDHLANLPANGRPVVISEENFFDLVRDARPDARCVLYASERLEPRAAGAHAAIEKPAHLPHLARALFRLGAS